MIYFNKMPNKNRIISDPSISQSQISFPTWFILICGHNNKTLRRRNGWISGIRPTGALIIHVSAREHVAGARHSTGHAVHICLISSIKGRCLFVAFQTSRSLLCNIQRSGVTRRRSPAWSYRHRFLWKSRRIHMSYSSIAKRIGLE